MVDVFQSGERRGKRSRQVVVTKPEESRLTPRQLIIALSAVVIFTWAVLQLTR